MRRRHPTHSDAASSSSAILKFIHTVQALFNMQAQYKGQYSGLPNRGWGVGIPRLLHIPRGQDNLASYPTRVHSFPLPFGFNEKEKLILERKNLIMANVYQSIQGNMGLGKAIEYFTSHGIPIAIPLNDTQKYDLIADFNGQLQRISVKTSRYSTTQGKSYEVVLKNSGGSSGKSVIRHFDNTSCDYLFIYTADENLYLIPTKAISTFNTISVGIKYTEYKVSIKTLKEYTQNLEQ